GACIVYVLMNDDLRCSLKLEPAESSTDQGLDKFINSLTAVLMVSGTDGVTSENITTVLEKNRDRDINIALEISHHDAVIHGFDHYYMPTVINTVNVKYSHGMLVEALIEYHDFIEYDNISLLPYIILNENCKAFTRAECKQINDEELLAMVHMLDKLYKMDYIYIEYSGMLGDRSLVKEAYDACEHAHVIYGGGIQNYDQAKLMSSASDTIVVGNIIYDDVESALTTII